MEEADGELALRSRDHVLALPWSESGFRPQVQSPFRDLIQGSGGNSRQKPEHSGQERDLRFHARPSTTPGGRHPRARLEEAEPLGRGRCPGRPAWALASSSQLSGNPPGAGWVP